jgi:hypothetical protein
MRAVSEIFPVLYRGTLLVSKYLDTFSIALKAKKQKGQENV